MSGMARGRLPARVYWVRRLMVLAIAALLVVGIAKLLGGSGGSPDPAAGDRATNVADTTSSSGSDPTSSSSGGQTPGHRHSKAGGATTPVAMPTGHCSATDVAITPTVPKPVGGRDISVVLDLSSLTTPACTWSLSPTTLAMKITSGPDLIWTTAECSRSIPSQDLVLRQATPTRVRLSWDARRSEPGCPDRTDWARPGTYHLDVAALGGQPQDVTFLLTAPTHPDSTGSGNQGKPSGKPGSTQGKKHHGKHKKRQIPPG